MSIGAKHASLSPSTLGGHPVNSLRVAKRITPGLGLKWTTLWGSLSILWLKINMFNKAVEGLFAWDMIVVAQWRGIFSSWLSRSGLEWDVSSGDRNLSLYTSNITCLWKDETFHRALLEVKHVMFSLQRHQGISKSASSPPTQRVPPKWILSICTVRGGAQPFAAVCGYNGEAGIHPVLYHDIYALIPALLPVN